MSSHSVDVYVEVCLKVEGTYSPGRPMRGPSFSSPGEPAEDPEIEYEVKAIAFVKRVWDPKAEAHKFVETDIGAGISPALKLSGFYDRLGDLFQNEIEEAIREDALYE